MWYDAFVFSFYAIMHLVVVVLILEKTNSLSYAVITVFLLFIAIAVCYEGWRWMGWVN
jgi:hypothetical protein